MDSGNTASALAGVASDIETFGSAAFEYRCYVCRDISVLETRLFLRTFHYGLLFMHFTWNEIIEQLGSHFVCSHSFSVKQTLERPLHARMITHTAC